MMISAVGPFALTRELVVAGRDVVGRRVADLPPQELDVVVHRQVRPRH